MANLVGVMLFCRLADFDNQKNRVKFVGVSRFV